MKTALRETVTGVRIPESPQKEDFGPLFFETNIPFVFITTMENTNTTNMIYNFKPSKADIIQRLLDEKHITVEEAMTLMAPDAPVMPTPPYTPPTPGQTSPYWPSYPVYCQSSTF